MCLSSMYMRQGFVGGPVSENLCACGYMIKFMILREANVFMWVLWGRIFPRVGNDIEGSLGRLLNPGPPAIPG